jgi:hypothetical protein
MIADVPVTMISPAFGSRANGTSARSISPALRVSIGVNSTPSNGATDWIAAN